jgi:hypothetical protein
MARARSAGVRHLASLVLAAVTSTTLASAEPAVVGGNLGVAEGTAGRADQSTSVGVWARKSLQRGVWAQLELSRVDTSGRGTPTIMPPPGGPDVLSGGVMIGVDLERHGPLVPVFLVGAGVDRASNFVREVTYAHAEVGVGLELRSRSFLLGIDARLGYRDTFTEASRDVLLTFQTRLLTDGTYKQARLFAGISF